MAHRCTTSRTVRFRAPALAFSDMHIALAQAVAGNDAAPEERIRQIDDLARQGRYPSGPLVPTVARGFAAFERQDFSAAIDALEPITGELERIGGSRAQLDLVEFTLTEGLCRCGTPGRCAADAEWAASRLLTPSRCRARHGALIDQTTGSSNVHGLAGTGSGRYRTSNATRFAIGDAKTHLDPGQGEFCRTRHLKSVACPNPSCN